MLKLFQKLMTVHADKDGGVSTFKIVITTAYVIIAIVFLLTFIAITVDFNTTGMGKPDLSKIGAIGDFVGGILNPLLAFIVLLVLLATTKLQKEELSATKDELAKSAATAERQGFETTFFNLISLINQNVRSAEIRKGSKSLRGQEAFERIYQVLKDPRHNGGSSAETWFPTIYNTYRSELGHYIRVIYWTLSWLKEHDDEPSNNSPNTYGRILRAQLSDYELALLFYNCISSYGENFRALALHFQLFNSLDESLLIGVKKSNLVESFAPKLNNRLP